MKYIRLKDMPPSLSLVGRHFKGNKNLKIKSGWNKGLWLQKDGDSQVIPMFFNSFQEIENKMISVFEGETL